MADVAQERAALRNVEARSESRLLRADHDKRTSARSLALRMGPGGHWSGQVHVHPLAGLSYAGRVLDPANSCDNPQIVRRPDGQSRPESPAGTATARHRT